ncbi:hypothetical protein GMSM_43240 [Geomonas sp. Red276]
MNFQKVLMVVAIVFHSSLALAQTNGFLNMNRGLIESKAAQKAKSVLAEVAKRYEAEKKNREDVLKALKAELKGDSMPLPVRQAKENEFKSKMADYKAFLKDAQSDLEDINSKLTDYIVNKLVAVARSGFDRDKFYGIYVLDSETHGLGQRIAGQSGGSLEILDCEDLTDQMVANLNRDDTLLATIVSRPPYILPADAVK